MFDFKSAKPEDVRKKLDEIVKKSSGHLTLSSRALNDVEDAIFPQEDIFAIGEGLYNNDLWLILVTDRRVLMLCRSLFLGLKSKTIRLEDIKSIQSIPGRIMTNLIIQEGTVNLVIENVQTLSAQFIENKINLLLKGQKLGVAASAVPENEHLAALAALVKQREARLIDEDEFDRQKAALMQKYLES